MAMNKNTGFGPIAIVIALAVILGGGYMLMSQKSKVEPARTTEAVVQSGGSVKEETNSEMSGWKTHSDGATEYPADWTVQENISYAVDGKSVAYKGRMLVPPEAKTSLSEDRIFIGAPRVSVCSDVPDATKCTGGGKGSSLMVTFTNSKNPYVLQMFDAIIQRWEKGSTDWKTYRNDKYGFELRFPQHLETHELESKSVNPNIVYVTNPTQGLFDGDQPADRLLIKINPNTQCEPQQWKQGFGLVNWKTACIAADPHYFLLMSALSTSSQSTFDQVVSTFMFTN